MSSGLPALHAQTLLSDGAALRVRHWPLPGGRPPRANVLLVHGIGEHSGRYDGVARRLNAWGCNVTGYDHIGHGESAGPRGVIGRDDRLLLDLSRVVDHVRALNTAPLVLIGHSLGGLLCARWVSQADRPVDALVLSSPALDPGLTAWQRLQIALAYRLMPDVAVHNGLPLEALSHDAGVVAEVVADPLCHTRISGRLARFIQQASAATLACAPDWKLPTLLLVAGADRLVNPEGSVRFARAAPADLVQIELFAAYRHELFFELDPEPVFEALHHWLQPRLFDKAGRAAR